MGSATRTSWSCRRARRGLWTLSATRSSGQATASARACRQQSVLSTTTEKTAGARRAESEDGPGERRPRRRAGEGPPPREARPAPAAPSASHILRRIAGRRRRQPGRRGAQVLRLRQGCHGEAPGAGPLGRLHRPVLRPAGARDGRSPPASARCATAASVRESSCAGSVTGRSRVLPPHGR